MLEIQTRIELTENHATFGALGFIKVAETAHTGYSNSTSITMHRAVPVGVAGAAAPAKLEIRDAHERHTTHR